MPTGPRNGHRPAAVTAVAGAAPIKKKRRQSESPAPQAGTPLPHGVMSLRGIRLEPLESATVYYINYIEVASSPQDFTIICGRLPGKLSSEKFEEVKNGGVLVIEPDVQLVIPTTLVP
jgi:hypothetical protein